MSVKGVEMEPKIGTIVALCAALAMSSTLLMAQGFTDNPDSAGRIAFSSNRSGTAQIYLMNEDGSGQTRLTNSAPFDDMHPAWSPDGRRIAFTRGVGYQSANLIASSIMVTDAGGGDEQVIADEEGINVKPAWSPNGQKILYAHGTATQTPFELWIMNTDGTEKHAVPNSRDAFPAAWSADGRRIVFNRALDIWTMDINGTGLSRLTTTGNNYTPNWAPADRIVFTSTRDGAGKQMYVMEANGENQVRLVDDGAENKFPAWSPDGSRISYSRSTVPCVAAQCSLTQLGGYEIFSMNADGSGQIRLTNTTPPGREFGEGYPAYEPRVAGHSGSDASTSTDANKSPLLPATGSDSWLRAIFAIALILGGSALRRVRIARVVPCWIPRTRRASRADQPVRSTVATDDLWGPPSALARPKRPGATP